MSPAYKRWYDHDPKLLEVIELLKNYQDELREHAVVFLEKVEQSCSKEAIDRFYDMVKPVNVNEMVLRVSALLRRAQMINERRQTIGNTVLECDSLTVTVDGSKYILPQKEFMLLYKMASFPGRIFTRQQLMDDIWGYDSETDTHTVDVHIGRLREKFSNNKDFKIITMRGVGYKVVKL